LECLLLLCTNKILISVKSWTRKITDSGVDSERWYERTKNNTEDDKNKTSVQDGVSSSTDRDNVQPSTTNVDNSVEDQAVTDSQAGVLQTIKSLGTNGTYVFALLYSTVDFILLNGFAAFGAKYFQQQFGVTPSIAGISVGTFTNTIITIRRRVLGNGVK